MPELLRLRHPQNPCSKCIVLLLAKPGMGWAGVERPWSLLTHWATHLSSLHPPPHPWGTSNGFIVPGFCLTLFLQAPDLQEEGLLGWRLPDIKEVWTCSQCSSIKLSSCDLCVKLVGHPLRKGWYRRRLAHHTPQHIVRGSAACMQELICEIINSSFIFAICSHT